MGAEPVRRRRRELDRLARLDGEVVGAEEQAQPPVEHVHPASASAAGVAAAAAVVRSLMADISP